MYSREISLQEWADVNDEMAVTDRAIAGTALTVVGAHHQLGQVVIVETTMGTYLISELPYSNELDQAREQQDGAVQNRIRELLSRGP